MTKRDNAYFLERLKNEHPTHFAKLQSGLYRSPREAFIKAGLRKDTNRLKALLREWKKASPSERADFLGAIEIGKKVSTTPAQSASHPAKVVNNAARGRTKSAIGLGSCGSDAGYLDDRTIRRIKGIMAYRKLTMGQVMLELGFQAQNPALGLALSAVRPSIIRDEKLRRALWRWLRANQRV